VPEDLRCVLTVRKRGRECIETEGLHTCAVIIADGNGRTDDAPVNRKPDGGTGARRGIKSPKLPLEQDHNRAFPLECEWQRHPRHVFELQRGCARRVGEPYDLHPLEAPDATFPGSRDGDDINCRAQDNQRNDGKHYN